MLIAWLAAALAAPSAITHQGRVLDAAGAPISGAQTVEFHLYAAPSGGAPLWSATHDLTLHDGAFTVLLDGFEDDDFDGSTRYLAAEIDGAELGPRTPVVSVPYALRADRAARLDGPLVATDPGEAACDGGAAGTLRWADGDLQVCTGATGWLSIMTRGADDGGTAARAGASCRTIHEKYPWLGDDLYWVREAGGATVQVFCDMSTDGGGWTLGVNFTTDLGAIDLFTYRNRTANPPAGNYGLDLADMGLSTATEYRLTCTEMGDGTKRKFFLKGLPPTQPIFQAAGTLNTAGFVCSTSPDFSNPATGGACLRTDDGIHTYWGSTGSDVQWALFSSSAAYTLRHCAQRGAGYFNPGAIWYR
jgi:hypothetical protein